jgi:hypothetical protein
VDKALQGTLSSVVPSAAGFQAQRAAVEAAVRRTRAMDAAAAAEAAAAALLLEARLLKPRLSMGGHLTLLHLHPRAELVSLWTD